MASLFQNNRPTPFSPRQVLEHKYNAARSNLLLVIVFTVVNIVLLAAKSNLYFLFSASIPYFLTDLGMALCGMHPDEYYEGIGASVEFLPNTFFFVMLVLAFITVTLYFLCWLFSKQQRVGWMIFALVLFALDTLALFFLVGISVDSIFDILFHGWVLYYLIVGLSAHAKLKKLPPEEEPAVPVADPTEPPQDDTKDDEGSH